MIKFQLFIIFLLLFSPYLWGQTLSHIKNGLAKPVNTMVSLWYANVQLIKFSPLFIHGKR